LWVLSFWTASHAWIDGSFDRGSFTAIFDIFHLFIWNLLDDLWVIATWFNGSRCLFHFLLDLLNFGSLNASLWIILNSLCSRSTSSSALLQELSLLQTLLLFWSSSRSASVAFVALFRCVDGRVMLVLEALFVRRHGLIRGLSVQVTFELPDRWWRLVIRLRYCQLSEVNLTSLFVHQLIVSQFWTGILCLEVLVLSWNLNLQIKLRVFELSFTQRLLLSVSKGHYVLIDILLGGSDMSVFVSVVHLISISFSAIFWDRIFNLLPSVFWI